MKLKLIYTCFIVCFSFFGISQTYQVIEATIKCESYPLQGNLNSKANDFSPFVSGNTIYFSSDRSPDIFLNGENNWKKNKTINVYQAEIKDGIGQSTKVKNRRLVSERLTSLSHTGPICLSITGDTAFFSQVRITEGNDINYPQLYYTVRVKRGWSTPVALPFNNAKYSYGHPFYQSGTRRLYFSSDHPDGKGGKDLYYSELTETGWEAPVPLADVNTSGDEMYPFIEGGILFYTASNGDNGLDLMWKIHESKQKAQAVDGLSSKHDDFGIFVFPGMKKGYYSSNTNGQDDIFFFTMKCVFSIRNEIAGEFTFRNLDGIADNVLVQILDENDFVLYETRTDENGNFTFGEVEFADNYSIKAISEDGLELSLKDESGSNVVSLISDEHNKFGYRRMGPERTGTSALIPDDMINFELNEGQLSGQLIYDDKPGEYPENHKVTLVDANGDVKFTAYTDAYGNFDFEKLPMDANYQVQVPEAEKEMVLMVYDSKDNVVAQLKSDKNGKFVFRKLDAVFGTELELIPEEELTFEYNAKTISGYFDYKNNMQVDRKGMTVKAYNEEGKLLYKETTDKGGMFRFKSLPMERTLLFKLEPGDKAFDLDDFTLFIYDRKGNKIAGLKRGQDGYFTYRPLGYEVNNDLSTIEQENLEFILGGHGDRKLILVYFDSNRSEVKKSDMQIINNIYIVLKDNPTARVEINAYADAKSSDEYNLILSQKRGNWIVNYLVNKGISKDRLIVNAYGEASLVDENNDALNRRAEIHLY